MSKQVPLTEGKFKELEQLRDLVEAAVDHLSDACQQAGLFEREDCGDSVLADIRAVEESIDRVGHTLDAIAMLDAELRTETVQ